MNREGVSRKAALEFIRREDNGRRRYLKKYFNKDLDDPLLYHLVINTDIVPYATAAHMIRDALLNGLVRSDAHVRAELPVARSHGG